VFRYLSSALAAGLIVVLLAAPNLRSQQQQAQQTTTKNPHIAFGTHFQTSERCIACHNGLTTSSGEDISIGYNWRTSMMANAARDPYWQAGVRREIIDHPTARAAIEDECSICHMPAARYEAKLAGHEGEIFSHLPFVKTKPGDRLAADGVTCSVCHQISPDNFGKRESFVGGFKIDTTRPAGERPVYGPFKIENGQTTVMLSSATFKPTEAMHIRDSELCATCHTLLTQALNAQGQPIGELPEQVPYQEWLHSDYKTTQSCQTCHMPTVKEDVPISSVLGEPRTGMARHTFVGGNFFMQRLLNRFRYELGVEAQPQELEAAANRTVAHLQSEAARLAIDSIDQRAGRLEAALSVENLGGHKLPTAYPSRRVWLHVTVKDGSGRTVFESGAFEPTGAIRGNDNDADATRFEPHYTEITSPDQVQIYETVMAGPSGALTTGLLTAVRYVKDNRLLPRGFDKRTADKDVAVHGEALQDADFAGGVDRIRYSVAVGDAQGPFQVDAELWYQPIAHRWAANLKPYDAFEPRRFTGYYDSMSSSSGIVLARASTRR
jgi:hypothetical protein